MWWLQTNLLIFCLLSSKSYFDRIGKKAFPKVAFTSKLYDYQTLFLCLLKIMSSRLHKIPNKEATAQDSQYTDPHPSSEARTSNEVGAGCNCSTVSHLMPYLSLLAPLAWYRTLIAQSLFDTKALCYQPVLYFSFHDWFIIKFKFKPLIFTFVVAGLY